MNRIFTPKLLPLLPLGAGILGLILRTVLYATGIDAKGLLAAGHPLQAVLWILTALVIGGVFLCTRAVPTPKKYFDRFPPSPLAAFGSLAAGVGILLTEVLEVSAQADTLGIVCLVLGIGSALSLGMVAHSRIKNLRPSFFFHLVVTVYLMLHPLSQYRIWCADPQLFDYCFHLLASVFLMLAAYQRTTLDAGLGNCRQYAFFSQCALFFCCMSINGDSWLFYLTMALWTATGLCATQPPQEDLQ